MTDHHDPHYLDPDPRPSARGLSLRWQFAATAGLSLAFDATTREGKIVLAASMVAVGLAWVCKDLPPEG